MQAGTGQDACGLCPAPWAMRADGVMGWPELVKLSFPGSATSCPHVRTYCNGFAQLKHHAVPWMWLIKIPAGAGAGAGGDDPDADADASVGERQITLHPKQTTNIPHDLFGLLRAPMIEENISSWRGVPGSCSRSHRLWDASWFLSCLCKRCATTRTKLSCWMIASEMSCCIWKVECQSPRDKSWLGTLVHEGIPTYEQPRVILSLRRQEGLFFLWNESVYSQYAINPITPINTIFSCQYRSVSRSDW